MLFLKSSADPWARNAWSQIEVGTKILKLFIFLKMCCLWFKIWEEENEICKIPASLELCSTGTIANLFPNSLQMLCSQIADRIHEQILSVAMKWRLIDKLIAIALIASID